MRSVFGRRRHQRSADLSAANELIAAAQAERLSANPVPIERLPVVVGLAELHADVIAKMPMQGVPINAPANPDPREDVFYTTHKAVKSLWYTGNVYGLTDARPGVRATSMTVLNPDTVLGQADYDTDPNAVAEWWVNGRQVDGRNIIWSKINDDPRTGPLGVSPLVQAREPLAMYGAAYAYLTMFFESGGNPSSILSRTGPGNLTYSNEKAVADWIEARRQRRPAVMPEGWTLTVPANNGELDTVRQVLEHSAAEVARLTNVPPSIANAKSMTGNLTYATTEGELRRWLALSLTSWICRIELWYSAFYGTPITLDYSGMFDIVAVNEPAPAAAPQLAAVAPIDERNTA